MHYVRLLIQVMQTWTSTTRIITLQCGKSSSVTDVVLVLPKNRLEIGLLRLTHTEFFGIEPRVDVRMSWVREKVKMWMSPSATTDHYFVGEWDKEQRKWWAEIRVLGRKNLDKNEGGKIATASLALSSRLSNVRLCFSHKVGVELIHWGADSNAKP